MTVTLSKFYEVSFVEALQNIFILKKTGLIFWIKHPLASFVFITHGFVPHLHITLSTQIGCLTPKKCDIWAVGTLVKYNSLVVLLDNYLFIIIYNKDHLRLFFKTKLVFFFFNLSVYCHLIIENICGGQMAYLL